MSYVPMFSMSGIPEFCSAGKHVTLLKLPSSELILIVKSGAVRMLGQQCGSPFDVDWQTRDSPQLHCTGGPFHSPTIKVFDLLSAFAFFRLSQVVRCVMYGDVL